MVFKSFYVLSKPKAAAKSVNAGTDIDLGSDVYFSPKTNGGNGALEKALKKGLTSEYRIN